jgi:23S rRNA-/tRNA-specific pseudouridylate synthase
MDIDIPLMENPFKPGATIPSARGEDSLTILKTLKNFRNATLVECRLVTGRHHQLRAHVAAIGHPLLVDDIYGSSSEFFVSSLKRKFNLKKDEEESPLISRITMHAQKIGFKHPNGEYVEFEAAYPKDFKALIQTLTKYSSL